MFWSRHKQIRKKNANESELTPMVEPTAAEKTIPRIRRISTIARQPPFNDDTSSSQTNNQSNDTSHINEALTHHDSIIPKAVGNKLDESHPRFGPVYSVDQPPVQATKDKAWEHVLIKSMEKHPSLERSAIEDQYLTSIGKVEKEAKENYAEKIPGTRSDFLLMMIKDGCYFLQLALLILGSSPEQLGYPSNDPVFGKRKNNKDVRKWIEAMFYAGNQIPLVVLKALMKQEFFQDVIKKGKWGPTPSSRSSLCIGILYKVLVLPASKKDKGLSLRERIMGRSGNNNLVYQQHQPCDLLHGLQNLVMGPDQQLGNNNLVSDDHDDRSIIDLEANEEEIDDEATPVNDRKRVFPSATELRQAGIHIHKLKSSNAGVRSIRFTSCCFRAWAYLYLPAFPVDDSTEIILQNLKAYEQISQQQSGKNRAEISSYLSFMSDIIQTTNDAKFLQRQGIVMGDSDDVDKLPGILSRLNNSSGDVRLTQEFRNLRRQIRDYSSPWIHYKGLLNFVAVLTLVQTFFTVLAYFRPTKP